jgi:hypothetical protein
MPKLPDALGTPQDLGAVPPDPSPLIPHYQAGQVGAAMQGFAGDLGASANQILDLQDRLSRAAAEQDFISRKLDLDQQFASDPDYSTAPQRYRQSLLQALNDTSQGILGPAQRADFQQQMSRFTESGVDSILRQSVAKARDAGRANITQASGVAVSDALRTTDETNLNPIFNALNDRIQASMEAGYLSRDEAVALRKSTAQSYVSQRGWLLADADPQQAVDTLKPSALGEDGQPSFAKVGDWRDLLDQSERTSMVQRAQQNLELQQRAAGIEALRQQRQQQKADTDTAQAIASRYVDQLAADPTSVDVGALARENFPDSQQGARQALLGAAQTAIAQAGDKTAAGYGPGFWPAFNRVTAADGDPSNITDPAELYKLAGPEGGGALTMQGVQQLQRFLDQSKTVEGRAQNAMEQMFLRQAHAAITGTDAPADPAGETRFQNFLGAYFPALQDGLASGKSAMRLLSVASADYLGKLIPAFAPASPPDPDRRDDGAPGAASASFANNLPSDPDLDPGAAAAAGASARAAIAVGKDIGVGLTELPKQVAGGAIDFGNNLMKFADDAVKRAEEAGLPNIYFQLFDKDGNWAPRMLSTEEFRAEQAAGTNGIFQVPTTGSAQSVTGNIVRTGTTFLLGRGGLAKGGGVLANVGASGASGALMDPREPRLSNLIDSIAPNFITDWLKVRPDQEQGLLDRLKSAAEYAGLDLGFAGVSRVLRSVKDALTDAGADSPSGKGAAPPALDAHSAAEAETPAVQPAPAVEAPDQAAAGERAVPGVEVEAGPATLSPFQDTEG